MKQYKNKHTGEIRTCVDSFESLGRMIYVMECEKKIRFRLQEHHLKTHWEEIET